jgi:hypothetical protein
MDGYFLFGRTPDSGRPDLRFRTALPVLFASCGIWILAFGLGWLREPISEVRTEAPEWL